MAGKSKTVAYAGVRLVADIGDFKKKMKSASKRVADFSKKTAKFALGAGVGITALSATVVAGVVATTKAVAESVDPMAKYARDMGLAFETLGDLVHVNGLFGISQQQTQQSLTKTSKFLGEVQRGMSEQVKTLDALGLSYDDLADKDVAGQQKELLRALAGVEDMALRNSYAMQIFGRFGTQFAGLSQQFDAYTQSLEDFESQNLSMTTAQAEKLEAFNDAYSNMEIRLKSVTGVMASEFAPTLTKGFDAVTMALDEILADGEFIDSLFSGLNETINSLTFDDMTSGVDAVTESLKEAINFSFNLVKAFEIMARIVKLSLETVAFSAFDTFKAVQQWGAESNIKIYDALGLDDAKKASQERLALLTSERSAIDFDFSSDASKIGDAFADLIEGSDIGDKTAGALNKLADKVIESAKNQQDQIDAIIDDSPFTNAVKAEQENKVDTAEAKQTAKENKVAFAGTAEALNSNYLTQSNEIAKRQLRELQKISKRKPQQANYTMVSI